jgi:predicted membrane channel-forming protein YqfA (hemolysin III family)
MEALFIIALVLTGLFILFACLEAETWTPVVFGVISFVSFTVGLYFYLQTEPTATQYTTITDRLELNSGNNGKYLIFPKPTHIKVTFKKRWGSADSETIYTVLGE